MPIATNRRKPGLSLVSLSQIFIGFLVGWYVLIMCLRYQPQVQSKNILKKEEFVKLTDLINEKSLSHQPSNEQVGQPKVINDAPVTHQPSNEQVGQPKVINDAPVTHQSESVAKKQKLAQPVMMNDISLDDVMTPYKLPVISMNNLEFFHQNAPKLINHDILLSQIVKNTTHKYECSPSVVKAINEPILNDDDYKWCEWALTVGEVEVGKSWGKLKTEERLKYERLSCNIVATTHSNPSCNDGWGDEHLQKWKSNKMNMKFCNTPSTSSLECYENVNKDTFCVGTKLKLDFTRLSTSTAHANHASRDFQPGFITGDCKEINENFNLYKDMLGAKNDAKCDHHVDYLLAYGHDHIDNLGHMLQDVMNIWMMMWLFDGKVNQVSKDQVMLLHIDGFLARQKYHDDKMNLFFETYYRNFKGIITANSLKNATLCVENLIFQPIVPKFFVWDSWTTDLPCGFRGPSSLFQRWNFQVRNSYGLLEPSMQSTNEGITIVFIVRKEAIDDWADYRTSRILKNQEEFEKYVNQVTKVLSKKYNIPINFKPVNLAELKFADQIKLIGQSSLIIGVHGAGIASAMHMSIGTKYCCGILEIYPNGEFSVARGHGNMARKMGIYYDRIDTVRGTNGGLTLPVDDLLQLQNKITNLVSKMVAKSSCVLPDVRNNIYYVPP